AGGDPAVERAALMRGKSPPAAQELLEPDGGDVPGGEAREGAWQGGDGDGGVAQQRAGLVQGDPAGVRDEDRVGVALVLRLVPQGGELSQAPRIGECLVA